MKSIDIALKCINDDCDERAVFGGLFCAACRDAYAMEMEEEMRKDYPGRLASDYNEARPAGMLLGCVAAFLIEMLICALLGALILGLPLTAQWWSK